MRQFSFELENPVVTDPTEACMLAVPRQIAILTGSATAEVESPLLALFLRYAAYLPETEDEFKNQIYSLWCDCHLWLAKKIQDRAKADPNTLFGRYYSALFTYYLVGRLGPDFILKTWPLPQCLPELKLIFSDLDAQPYHDEYYVDMDAVRGFLVYWSLKLKLPGTDSLNFKLNKGGIQANSCPPPVKPESKITKHWVRRPGHRNPRKCYAGLSMAPRNVGTRRKSTTKE